MKNFDQIDIFFIALICTYFITLGCIFLSLIIILIRNLFRKKHDVEEEISISNEERGEVTAEKVPEEEKPKAEPKVKKVKKEKVPKDKTNSIIRKLFMKKVKPTTLENTIISVPETETTISKTEETIMSVPETETSNSRVEETKETNMASTQELKPIILDKTEITEVKELPKPPKIEVSSAEETPQEIKPTKKSTPKTNKNNSPKKNNNNKGKKKTPNKGKNNSSKKPNNQNPNSNKPKPNSNHKKSSKKKNNHHKSNKNTNKNKSKSTKK